MFQNRHLNPWKVVKIETSNFNFKTCIQVHLNAQNVNHLKILVELTYFFLENSVTFVNFC